MSEDMAAVDPVRRAATWLSAAGAGILVALVAAVADPPAYLMAALLLAASIPFGLLTASHPGGPARAWLGALAIGWPTVVARLSQDAGPAALVLFAYPLVGMYAGDWLACFRAEWRSAAAAASSQTSAE